MDSPRHATSSERASRGCERHSRLNDRRSRHSSRGKMDLPSVSRRLLRLAPKNSGVSSRIWRTGADSSGGARRVDRIASHGDDLDRESPILPLSSGERPGWKERRRVWNERRTAVEVHLGPEYERTRRHSWQLWKRNVASAAHVEPLSTSVMLGHPGRLTSV